MTVVLICYRWFSWHGYSWVIIIVELLWFTIIITGVRLVSINQVWLLLLLLRRNSFVLLRISILLLRVFFTTNTPLWTTTFIFLLRILGSFRFSKILLRRNMIISIMMIKLNFSILWISSQFWVSVLRTIYIMMISSLDIIFSDIVFIIKSQLLIRTSNQVVLWFLVCIEERFTITIIVYGVLRVFIIECWRISTISWLRVYINLITLRVTSDNSLSSIFIMTQRLNEAICFFCGASYHSFW